MKEFYKEMIALIGKSELDSELVRVMKKLTVKWPVKRPPKDEYYTNVVCKSHNIEFVFMYGEKIFENKNFKDGEMIISDIFFRQKIDKKNVRSIEAPYDLSWNTSRKELREQLGLPESSNDFFKSDSWTIDGMKVMVEFNDTESSIVQITSGLS